MNLHEAVQYTADGIGIMRGAEEPFGVPEELPCYVCGGLVNLTATVTMKIMETDGSQVQTEMTEAEARQFIAQSGLVPPPVLCEQHEELA